MPEEIGHGPVTQLLETDADDPEEICRIAVAESLLLAIEELEAEA